MPRTIELEDEQLVIRLSGISQFAALVESVAIPYRLVRSVSAAPYEVPPWTVKMAGTGVPFSEIKAGHFLHGKDRYFFSFEHLDRTVTLELEGFGLKTVVIGVEEPEAMREAIAARCPMLLDPLVRGLPVPARGEQMPAEALPIPGAAPD